MIGNLSGAGRGLRHVEDVHVIRRVLVRVRRSGQAIDARAIGTQNPARALLVRAQRGGADEAPRGGVADPLPFEQAASSVEVEVGAVLAFEQAHRKDPVGLGGRGIPAVGREAVVALGWR